MKKFIACLLLFFSVVELKAFDPVISLYQNNRVWFNPAYSGLEGKNVFALAGKNTFLKNSSNVASVLLSYDNYFEKAKGGVGGVFLMNNFGSFSFKQFGLNYSYGVKFTDDISLSGGLQLALLTATRDYANSSTVIAGPQSVFRPDVDAGIWLNVFNFYGGYSIRHIAQPKFKFYDLNYNLNKIHYLTAGIKLKVNENVSTVPSFIYRGFYDINNTIIYKEMLSLGLSYRTTHKTFVANAGVELFKKVTLGLAYDFSGANSYNYSSFDAVLKIKI